MDGLFAFALIALAKVWFLELVFPPVQLNLVLNKTVHVSRFHQECAFPNKVVLFLLARTKVLVPLLQA